MICPITQVSTSIFSVRETRTQGKESEPPIYGNQADCRSTRLWVMFEGQHSWIVRESRREQEGWEEKQCESGYEPFEGVACKRSRGGDRENATGVATSRTWKKKKLRLDISVKKDQTTHDWTARQRTPLR